MSKGLTPLCSRVAQSEVRSDVLSRDFTQQCIEPDMSAAHVKG
jgi:hypothetical protein